jgi:hypothetical protein
LQSVKTAWALQINKLYKHNARVGILFFIKKTQHIKHHLLSVGRNISQKATTSFGNGQIKGQVSFQNFDNQNHAYL